jgi:hypothetical protein
MPERANRWAAVVESVPTTTRGVIMTAPGREQCRLSRAQNAASLDRPADPEQRDFESAVWSVSVIKAL